MTFYKPCHRKWTNTQRKEGRLRMITNLFDFQRFQQNARLENIIQDVEARYDNAISDDDLEWVSAAGGASSPEYADTFMDPELANPRET